MRRVTPVGRIVAVTRGPNREPLVPRGAVYARVPAETVVEWQGKHDVLHKAHSTLVFALVVLLLAGMSAAFAVAARRSLRRGG